MAAEAHPDQDPAVDDRRGPLWALPLALLVVTAAVAAPSTRTYALTVVVLMAVIALHEFGHLLAARACGVGAPEFSVGFGPLIWRSRRVDRHGTRYALRAIPFGGYVRIDGLSNELEGQSPPVPGKRSYEDVSAPRRMAIAAAGPLMNLVVAFVLLSAVFGAAGTTVATLEVNPLAGSPAEQSGVQPGDRIVSVNEVGVDDWDEAMRVLGRIDSPSPISLVVERDGVEVPLVVTPVQSASGRWVIGIQSQLADEHVSPTRAVVLSARTTGTLTWRSLSGMTSVVSAMVNVPQQLAGTQPASGDGADSRLLSPIGAAQVAEQSAQENGYVGPLILVASASVFLAVFNLLPLPPLDGGHILVAAYEGVASRLRRREVRVNRARLAPVAAGVVAVVLVLGVSSLLLDVLRPVSVGP